MGYRLPPLTTLRLFEAAGRLSSFKAAAEELNVTPSAVSHGIRTLEDWLGTRLFTRGSRGLALTAAGAAFLPQVQAALNLLVQAVDGVPGRRVPRRLTISCAPTFASRWLLPNLPQFQAAHPEIEVSIDTTHRQVDMPRDNVDVAIRMGQGDWPGLRALKLVDERLVPVCAPSLAGRIRTVDDLCEAGILRVSTVTEDWPAWLRAVGARVDPPRSLSFDTIHMALAAAAQGLGVALGRLPMIERDIGAGTLVPVLGPPQPCRTGYWLVAPADAFARPELAAFRDWIRRRMAEPPTLNPPSDCSASAAASR